MFILCVQFHLPSSSSLPLFLPLSFFLHSLSLHYAIGTLGFGIRVELTYPGGSRIIPNLYKHAARLSFLQYLLLPTRLLTNLHLHHTTANANKKKMPTTPENKSTVPAGAQPNKVPSLKSTVRMVTWAMNGKKKAIKAQEKESMEAERVSEIAEFLETAKEGPKQG